MRSAKREKGGGWSGRISAATAHRGEGWSRAGGKRGGVAYLLCLIGGKGTQNATSHAEKSEEKRRKLRSLSVGEKKKKKKFEFFPAWCAAKKGIQRCGGKTFRSVLEEEKKKVREAWRSAGLRKESPCAAEDRGKGRKKRYSLLLYAEEKKKGEIAGLRFHTGARIVPGKKKGAAAPAASAFQPIREKKGKRRRSDGRTAAARRKRRRTVQKRRRGEAQPLYQRKGRDASIHTGRKEKKKEWLSRRNKKKLANLHYFEREGEVGHRRRPLTRHEAPKDG